MSIDVKSVIDNYGVNDIKTLEGIEAIRLRPGMYRLSNTIYEMRKNYGTAFMVSNLFCYWFWNWKNYTSIVK